VVVTIAKIDARRHLRDVQPFSRLLHSL